MCFYHLACCLLLDLRLLPVNPADLRRALEIQDGFDFFLAFSEETVEFGQYLLVLTFSHFRVLQRSQHVDSAVVVQDVGSVHILAACQRLVSDA